MRGTTLLGALAAAASPVAALGEEAGAVSVEAGLSTLGAYVAPGVALGGPLRLRAPIYYGGLSGTIEEGGADLDTDLDVLSGALMADYDLGRGFRVSAGLSFGGYEATGTTSEVTLDGVTYAADFEARLEQEREVAPVISAGYARGLSGGWGISAELGVRLTDMTLTTTGQEALPDAERAQFEESIAGINDDLDAIGVLPFLALGVTYSF